MGESYRVQNMAKIYRGAQRVITYIGEGDSDTESAISLARRMLNFGLTPKSNDKVQGSRTFEEECAEIGISGQNMPDAEWNKCSEPWGTDSETAPIDRIPYLLDDPGVRAFSPCLML